MLDIIYSVFSQVLSGKMWVVAYRRTRKKLILDEREHVFLEPGNNMRVKKHYRPKIRAIVCDAEARQGGAHASVLERHDALPFPVPLSKQGGLST